MSARVCIAAPRRLQAWVLRWKLPLVLAAANVCLLLVFYQLLTYQKSGGGRQQQHEHDES